MRLKVFIFILSLFLLSSCFEKQGVGEGYYENGKFYYWNGNMGQGKMEDGIKNGVWTFFNESRQKISQGTFDQDVLHGPWEFWYENGILESGGDFAQGQKAGNWKFYHLNGQKLSEGAFFEGFRIENWTFWYDTGQIQEKRRYAKGKNYLAESWFPDGRPMVVAGNGEYEYHWRGLVSEGGTYQDSLAHGLWQFFDLNGQLTNEKYYQSGVEQAVQ